MIEFKILSICFEFFKKENVNYGDGMVLYVVPPE